MGGGDVGGGAVGVWLVVQLNNFHTKTLPFIAVNQVIHYAQSFKIVNLHLSYQCLI